MKKMTNDEFLNKLVSIHNNDYTPLESYKGATTKIKVRHNDCGREYYTTPDNLYSSGCVECGYKNMKKKQRKTHDEFVQEVYDLEKDNYTVLTKYVNTSTKVKMKHNICGREYEVTPRDFLSGRRCPEHRWETSSKSITKTHDYFLTRLGDSLGDDYTLLSEYENSKTKMLIKHLKCGLEYEASPQHILSGKRCPNCCMIDHGIKMRKTHAQFVNEMGAAWFNEYELLSNYVKQIEKIKVKHISCGTVFEVVPDSLLRGSGCPRCKASHGELEIHKFLTDNHIDFVAQKMFDDCVYKERLRFDFAVVNNGKVVSLIEYNGIQHYEPVSFFGGKNTFTIQVIKDNIKRKYAEYRNIPLYEISYLENIEKSLSKIIPILIPR